MEFMLSQEIIIPRLSIAKYLYQLGYTQSKQSESVAFTSLLSFHDAVEIFLKLVAEQADIKSDNFSFLDYWDKIPSLTLKESMRSLNVRRVNLKHKGILPAKQDLEISRVNVTDFFEQNSKIQFGINFKDISLINLVAYDSVRQYLEMSQKALAQNKFEDSIENVAYAFFDLIHTYEKSKKKNYNKSLFDFGDSAFFTMSTQNNLRKLDSGFADNMAKINKTMEALQNSVKIMCLGIDYKKYAMFQFLTPTVNRSTNKLRATIYEYKNWTFENCQFCIDFVIESSLKLQDFDFDVQQLIKEEEFDLEYVSGDFEKGMNFKQVPKKEFKKPE